MGGLTSPTRDESSAGEVSVDALAFDDELSIGEFVELLDSKQDATLGS